VDYLPLERNRSWGSPRIKGKEYRPGELPGAFVYMITPGYLQAMGMKLRGRDFTWDDGFKSESVIVLNEVCARYLFPGQDAVGRMVVMNGKDRRIIGVLHDVHEANVEGQPGWQVYFPALQERPVGAELVVRTKLPPAALATTVMVKLRELNPNQTAAEFRSIQQIVDHAVSPRRFFVLLVVSFAAFGVILAALGIYGVISYSVTQRTQEIGIRMALGATVGRVQMGVLGKTIRLALIGILAGTAASFMVAKGIAALLFGTAPTDPATFAAIIDCGLSACAPGFADRSYDRASKSIVGPPYDWIYEGLRNTGSPFYFRSKFFFSWGTNLLRSSYPRSTRSVPNDNLAAGSRLHVPASLPVSWICACRHPLHRPWHRL
jgi:hypothetical protein